MPPPPSETKSSPISSRPWRRRELFHIDLNDQALGRHDQDLRFGSANPKSAFFLVKFLEDVGHEGSRHFDADAYRTEDYDGVKDFARGCMHTYLILKEKAERWNADPEIQALVAEMNADDGLAELFLFKVGPRSIGLALQGGANLLAELPDETLTCPGEGTLFIPRGASPVVRL